MSALLLELSWAVAAGVLLGMVYFAGLGWTVARLARARWPGVLLVTSFAARLALLLGGLWLVGGGAWYRLVACALGVVVARVAAVRVRGGVEPC